jgi:hypothetical protein
LFACARVRILGATVMSLVAPTREEFDGEHQGCADKKTDHKQLRLSSQQVNR